MSVKLSKKIETVYIARCQWACAKDVNGKDIVPFGILWERKSYDDAADLVDRHALKTYRLDDVTRFYHTWLEQLTRYDDGSEESMVVREYNRPAEGTDKRTERITTEPWLAEVSDIIALAAREGVTLSARDIKGMPGDFTIDGMEWWAWLEAMTQR